MQDSTSNCECSIAPAANDSATKSPILNRTASEHLEVETHFLSISKPRRIRNNLSNATDISRRSSTSTSNLMKLSQQLKVREVKWEGGSFERSHSNNTVEVGISCQKCLKRLMRVDKLNSNKKKKKLTKAELFEMNHFSDVIKNL